MRFISHHKVQMQRWSNEGTLLYLDKMAGCWYTWEKFILL